MKRRLAILILTILQLGFLSTVDARDPTAPKSKQSKTHKSSAKELSWDASRPEERIQRYNVYEKIVGKDQKVTWKKIATVSEPHYKLKRLGPGPHIFTVTAVSPAGESQRSAELVVEN